MASAAVAALAAAHMAAVAQESEEDEPDDRIVVTGSRIALDSVTAANSPVLAIGAEEIQRAGESDITFLLREAPALNNSLPGSFSAFNAADTEDSDLGVGFLNLRNLGIERTLVLQNGRRHVSGASGQQAVDVNTIPASMIDRVEVLTGGASSIYGADAVSGVVNFILRDGGDFNGLEARIQTGISDRGDAEEFIGSVATGFEFDGGRGDAVVGVEYTRTSKVFASDRDFAGSGIRGFFPLDPENPALADALGADPSAFNTFAPNLTLPISSALGIIAIGDGPGTSAFVNAATIANFDFAGVPTLGASGVPIAQVFDNGALRPYNPGDIISGPFNAVGGDAVPTTPDVELILPETDRVVLNANASYELNRYANFFMETKFAFTDTTDSVQVNGFNDDIPIALDNAFIPADLQAQILSLQGEGIDPTIVMSRDTLDREVLPLLNAERQTFRIVGGVEGELPYNTAYEISYNFGRTDSSVTNSNTRLEDRFFAAVDAVVDPDTGEIVCRSELDGSVPPTSPFPFFSPGQNADGSFRPDTFQLGNGECQPINLFGANSITGAGADFAFVPTTDRTVVTQNVLLATLTGDTEDFFSLQGGPIGWAAGIEYREDESRFTPDPLDTAGFTFGAVSAGPTLPSGGDDEVFELFGEARLPLLAGLPLVNQLEVNGSARRSDYTSIGAFTTWSVGGRYSPVPAFTLRSTYAEATRIPNLGELFAPQQPATLGADSDPCNPQFIDAGTQFREENCLALVGPDFNSTDFNSAFVAGVSGGNPNLNPEFAETFTIGGIFEGTGPLEGLQVIADYYDIEITGFIDDLSGFQIAQNCVDLPSLNNPFCDQIVRDPTNGNITFFTSGQVNLGSANAQGLDWSVSYNFPVPEIMGRANLGDMLLSAVGTRFLTYDIIEDPLQPDVVTDELGTFNDPKWIVNFAADWSLSDLTVGWRGRYESSQLLPGVTNEDIDSNPDFSDPFQTGDAFVHDFTADYQVRDDTLLYGGIVNAFDRDPFVGTLSRPAGPRGRFFFVGLQIQR